MLPLRVMFRMNEKPTNRLWSWALGLLLSTAPAWAQATHEFGLSTAGTTFTGDVGAYGMTVPQRAAFGAYYRIQGHRHYAFRAVYQQGQLFADDAQSGLSERINRNSHFRSPFWEASAQVEIDYVPQRLRSSKGQTTLYLFGGAGIMGFNPQAQYHGVWTDLQPLGTEGQGTPLSNAATYARTAAILPVGMGVRYRLGELLTVGAEAGWRITSTDYLDDVSGLYVDSKALATYNGAAAAALSDPSLVVQNRAGLPRGTAETLDTYATAGIFVGIHLETFLERCASFLYQ